MNLSEFSQHSLQCNNECMHLQSYLSRMGQNGLFLVQNHFRSYQQQIKLKNYIRLQLTVNIYFTSISDK